MKHIRHQETSHDSLFEDISRNIDTIYKLWEEGNKSLRFSIPILCAAKLEAFINVAGKLNVEHWDVLERKLSFKEKCLIVFSAVGAVFDHTMDTNKSVIGIFDIRNSLVHPKMKLVQIDENISPEEYERRSNIIIGTHHNLRSELTKEKVELIKIACDLFVSEWGNKLLAGQPSYWLSGGSSGSFTSPT